MSAIAEGVKRPTSRLLLPFALVALLLICGCSRKRPNVVLITFDTTRADTMGFANGRTDITPTLDKLAGNGTWFSTAITSQPLTVPAHATIMTGQLPHQHGVRNNGTYILDKKNVTLAETLKDAGYSTHAVVSAFVLDSQFGLDQGFDSYDDDLSGGPQQKMFMFREIRANQTANKAITWLQKGRPADRPFFLWIHFFDPHADYEPPNDIAERLPGERYEAEVAFADRELGRVVKTLEDLKLRDDTLFVMTSDHGESLGEHGEKSHGIYLYDATVRVPLVFSGKGVAKTGRVDALVRTADIAPTIQELLRLSPPKTEGTSLAGLMEGKSEKARTAYSESFAPRLNFGWAELRSERTLGTKFIDAPRPEIYDLRSDPREQKNIYTSAGAVPDAARPLVAALRRITAGDPFTHGKHGQANLDAETKRKLAALGYVWGKDSPSKGPRPDPKDRIIYWERFEDAQAAIRRREFVPALAMVRSVLDADKDNVVAMASMANVLARMNQRGEALEIYKRIIQLDPDRDTAYLGASRILRELGRFPEAEAYARTLMRLQPRNPEGLSAAADVLLEQGKYEESERLFRQALQIDPHSSLAISGLGNCLNRAGRLRDALQVLRNGHQHDRSSEVISYNLAVVVERLGDPAGAKKLYQDTLKLDPDHSMSWNNLGALNDRAGQTEEAIRCVMRARQADPMNVEAAYNLGILLMRTNKLAEALPHLNDTLALQPAFAPAAVQRARVLTMLDRKDEALRAWRSLAATTPAAWLQIARLELSLGHESEARAALREGLTRGGDPVREMALKDERLRPLVPKTSRPS